MKTMLIAAIAALVLTGCDGAVSVLDSSIDDEGVVPVDGGYQPPDASRDSGSAVDSGAADAGTDAGAVVDAGSDAGAIADAGQDAGAQDAGSDAGAQDSGVVADAGVDAGTDAGSDAGVVRYHTEIWSYHVPDQWYTAGWASGPFVWDPGQVGTKTLPDVVITGTTAPYPNTTTVTPGAAPLWIINGYGAGSWTVNDLDSGNGEPGGRGYVATCTITAAEALAAKADGQLRTTTCYATDGALFSSSVAGGEDFVTVTWRVGAF